MGLDVLCADEQTQAPDIDFDDVAVVFGVVVVDVFVELRLRQDLSRVAHEVAQQAKFGGGE